MISISDTKRRLLHEAVRENTRSRQEQASSRPRSTRRGWQRWRRKLLSVVMPSLLLILSYVLSLVPAEHRGLTPLAALVSRAVGSPPSAGVGQEAAIPESALPRPGPIDPTVFALGIKHIVLDGGHGGMDAGAIAPQGLLEKDITLDIVRHLRRFLVLKGFQVRLTREGDETVSLVERAAFANSKGADLFVSVHINSIEAPEVRGVETYYLGPTDDPAALRLAAMENRPSGYSLGDFHRLLNGVYLDTRRTESRRLAEEIQRHLVQSLRRVNPQLLDRGVKTAPFLVLIDTKMPAVLTEVSVLSNAEEARLLSTPEYRQRIAQALSKGIGAYVDAFNHASMRRKWIHERDQGSPLRRHRSRDLSQRHLGLEP